MRATLRFILGALIALVCLTAADAPPQLFVVTPIGIGPANHHLSPGAQGEILGQHFGSSPMVLLGGTAVDTFSYSDTLLYFEVPTAFTPGTTLVTVQNDAGTGNALTLMIDATSPTIVPLSEGYGTGFFVEARGIVLAPSAGDRILIYLDGLGAANPPDPPTVLFDGKPANLLGVAKKRILIDGSNILLPVTAAVLELPALTPGAHTLVVQAGGVSSAQVSFEVLESGLVLSHTGLFFNPVVGGTSPPAQQITVLSNVPALNFSVDVNTIGGGSWLSVDPQKGTALFDQPGVPLHVTANPAALAAGTYYGLIRVSTQDAKNSPQTATVVMNIAPAGTKVDAVLSTFGLLFLGDAGGTDPASQTLTVTNTTSNALTFTGAVSGSPNPFKVTPLDGSIDPGKSVDLTVQPSIAGLAAGVYDAKLKLAFAGSRTRTVDVLLIVSGPGATSGNEAQIHPRSSSCAPTKLVPVFTVLGDSFEIKASWGTAVTAYISDDCKNPVISADVVLTFSNGDPPLQMTSNRDGNWSVTWPPGFPRDGVVVTLTASQAENNLTGTATQQGGVRANPAVPHVSQNGVVDAASYQHQPLAPGGLVSIYGSALADDVAYASTLPLETVLLTTSSSTRGEELPLLFTSDGQVNAILPYDLPVNTKQQIIVIRNNQLSAPQDLPVGVARPAVLTVNAQGTGQGQIFVTNAEGNLIRADADNPAKPGDILVVFCAGLGAVTPAVPAGAAAPADPPAKTKNPVTVTIGFLGAPNVPFAGLSPMSSGLYQVNVQVPENAGDSAVAPLQLTVAGQSSPIVTFAIKKEK